MSGGHFNDCGYDYYKVAQFADELEEFRKEEETKIILKVLKDIFDKDKNKND